MVSSKKQAVFFRKGPGGFIQGWHNPKSVFNLGPKVGPGLNKDIRSPPENWGLRPTNPLELGRFAPGPCDVPQKVVDFHGNPWKSITF